MRYSWRVRTRPERDDVDELGDGHDEPDADAVVVMLAGWPRRSATAASDARRWRSVLGEGERDVEGEGVGGRESRRRLRSSSDLRCCCCWAATASERASSRSAS